MNRVTFGALLSLSFCCFAAPAWAQSEAGLQGKWRLDYPAIDASWTFTTQDIGESYETLFATHFMPSPLQQCTTVGAAFGPYQEYTFFAGFCTCLSGETSYWVGYQLGDSMRGLRVDATTLAWVELLGTRAETEEPPPARGR